jgi:hypothetical protein
VLSDQELYSLAEIDSDQDKIAEEGYGSLTDTFDEAQAIAKKVPKVRAFANPGPPSGESCSCYSSPS